MSKPVILVFSGYYLPGFKAGGPIRSLQNLVGHLSGKFDFRVITRDRDLGDAAPYSQVSLNEWVRLDEVYVYYLSGTVCTLCSLRKLIREVRPDIIYLNSFLDPVFTIAPLFLRRVGLLHRGVRVVLAPRGEFAQGALVLKAWKKKAFMFLAKWAGLYKGVTWQSSSAAELEDIRRWAGAHADIRVASNLSPGARPAVEKLHRKPGSSLRVVTVARVARNKNIAGALSILGVVSKAVDYHLYGPCEDQDYWQECQKIIADLPENIVVTYHGHMPHEQICRELSGYDLFFLPTHGENFGHVILEAFSAGLPVLISDQTPWRDLESKGVGWDISLACPERYHQVLDTVAEMDAAQYNKISARVFAFVESLVNDNEAVRQNEELFRRDM